MKPSVRRGLTSGGLILAGIVLFMLSHVVLLRSEASSAGLLVVRIMDATALVLVLAGIATLVARRRG